ncbi:MAG: hypothetical protein SFV15_01150 [Polyangiaceae bacterium]|nr:hypothetical protein [Polyangiaceae bacterium]
MASATALYPVSRVKKVLGRASRSALRSRYHQAYSMFADAFYGLTDTKFGDSMLCGGGISEIRA